MSEMRGKYTAGFKLEAVRPTEDSDRMAADVARALDISPKLVYRWRQAFKSEGQEAFRGHGKLPESEKKVRQLRREPKRVTQEQGNPRKAIDIFPQER